MRIRLGVTIAAAALVAAACAARPTDRGSSAPAHDAGISAAGSCAPQRPYRSRILADRVPDLLDAHMTPTRDGGMVIAFASSDDSRESASRFTVLGLDSSACVRWRRSFRGGWPIAQPARVGADLILVASRRGSRSDPSLRLNTLTASTGRVLRREDLSAHAGREYPQPTLVGDRRGDVAVLLSVPVGLGTAHCCTDMTVKLSRGARGARWSRDVIADPAIGVPAVTARPDGRMVLAYPRRGRLWVRTGTVAGRLAPPIDAGRLGGNFRSAAVALAEDGTIAVAWQSGTYSRPWRLRAAVRRARARGFAHPAQLGFAAADHGTLLEGPVPAVHIDGDSRVTVGFYAPMTAGLPQAMCARSNGRGRFPRPRPFTRHRPADLAGAGTVLGHTVSAAIMLAPDSNEPGDTLVAVGSGCRARSSQLLAPAAGRPVAATVDARDRVWILTASDPGALMLTVTTPRR